MSMEAKSLLARFLDGEDIEDVFDNGKPAPDHATSRRVSGGTQLTIQERFDVWLRANPFVYDLFVQYALEAQNKGFEHYGIQSIAERVRWHLDFETEDNYGGWKINNTYLSRLARYIEENEPLLKDFFSKRKLLRP